MKREASRLCAATPCSLNDAKGAGVSYHFLTMLNQQACHHYELKQFIGSVGNVTDSLVHQAELTVLNGPCGSPAPRAGDSSSTSPVIGGKLWAFHASMQVIPLPSIPKTEKGPHTGLPCGVILGPLKPIIQLRSAKASLRSNFLQSSGVLHICILCFVVHIVPERSGKIIRHIIHITSVSRGSVSMAKQYRLPWRINGENEYELTELWTSWTNLRKKKKNYENSTTFARTHTRAHVHK